MRGQYSFSAESYNQYLLCVRITTYPRAVDMETSPNPLSSAEVQALVISIRCAKCTVGTKSNGIDQAENLCQMYVDFSYILAVFSYIDGFLGFG